MEFPNPRTTDPQEHAVQRIFEVIPGALTWATLIGMVVFSFFAPLWVAVFIILFDLYWIHRTIFIVTYSVAAYRKLRWGVYVDWWARCQGTAHLDRALLDAREHATQLRGALKEIPFLSLAKRRSIRKELKHKREEMREIQTLIDSGIKVMDWRKVVHVVALPTAVEDPEILEASIRAVQESNFPNHQIIILVAMEEAEAEDRRKRKESYLREKFEGVFMDFIVTTHKVSAGEMKCKASNMTYAARRLVEYFKERSIDLKRVIFSNFDCDTVCHKQYFASLTYEYVTDPKRLNRSYQPLPMYNNNLWDTNAFVRIIVLSSSFWHLFQSTRREMVTFSSHSEPFDTLAKIDFWPVNMISEDSIIYWKAFSYFHGDYEVKVIPLPVSLDAVLADTYTKTIVNQYKQKRRWAYGIENFPIIMRSLIGDGRVSWYKKFRVAFEMLEGHHSWATSPIILALLGWLPLILGGPEFNESVIAHNLPFVTRYLMSLAMFGLVMSVLMSFLLLPPRPERYSRWRYLNLLFQWVLIPITAPFLGAMPAIESQTRVMFAKYFGSFWVTEKVRKK